MTIFAVSSSLNVLDATRHKADLRDLKIQNSQKLSESKYTDLTTKDWHIPRNPHQMDTQLHSYICTLRILFGEHCFLAHQVESLRNHMHNYWSIYEQYCKDFRTWGTKVIFAIDNGFQMHLRELLSPNYHFLSDGSQNISQTCNVTSKLAASTNNCLTV